MSTPATLKRTIAGALLSAGLAVNGFDRPRVVRRPAPTGLI